MAQAYRWAAAAVFCGWFFFCCHLTGCASDARAAGAGGALNSAGLVRLQAAQPASPAAAAPLDLGPLGGSVGPVASRDAAPGCVRALLVVERSDAGFRFHVVALPGQVAPPPPWIVAACDDTKRVPATPALPVATRCWPWDIQEPALWETLDGPTGAWHQAPGDVSAIRAQLLLPFGAPWSTPLAVGPVLRCSLR